MSQTAKKISQQPEMFIGRQPIYDSKLGVAAYELLYRNSSNNFAQISDDESATAQVIVNAFLEIGMENLVGDSLAFINVPRGLLLGQEIYNLPPERVVLEILESVELDDSVAHALRVLRDKGYTIALDDFIYDASKASFVELADIVKLDLMQLSTEEFARQFEILKQFNVKFLAEKIETRQEYLDCQQNRFSYYQGYYFSKPEVVSGTKTPTNRLAMLRIISRIYSSDVSMQEMEGLISQDVSLSFKLLKAINSAAFATTRRIDSIKQAISMLGLRRIRHWVSFLMFSEADDKPLELFRMSMIRAKMCELIAASLKAGNGEKAFTVGLFSYLDAIMNLPVQQLVSPLPLSDEVKLALLERQGKLGEILVCIENYEQGNWDAVLSGNLTPSELTHIYLESVKWATDVYDSLT